MCSVMYRVDGHHADGSLASRTEVMDLAEGKRVAFAELKAGRALVEIIGLDSTGPFVLSTYQPASVPSLHTRASKD